MVRKLFVLIVLVGAGIWGWQNSHRVTEFLNDGTLTAQVTAQIAKIKPLALLSMKVSSHDGTVVLTGHVRTSSDEREILEATRSVKGVTHIKDQVSVNEHLRSKEQIEEDLRLTALIKETLIKEEGMRGLNIHVEVHQADVRLTGEVPTSEQALLAGEMAKGIKGVKEVRNQIKVKPVQ